MIADPDSELGRRLQAAGVPDSDLLRTRSAAWPLGGALTVALPGGCAILHPRAWREHPGAYGYAWRHELVHVEQARRWGFLGYWRRHISARLRTRSLLAESDPVEAEAYAAQRAFSATPL